MFRPPVSRLRSKRTAKGRVRIAYLTFGLMSVALGLIGIFVPILPTVPFMLLAAFFFARGNPAWERRLLEHPRFGPPIRDWRERGAIGRRAKHAAILALAVSAAAGLIMIDGPWRYLPLLVALVSGTWIATRPV
jgi:uncharacterized membrane protein YbaN (DUF454 family)